MKNFNFLFIFTLMVGLISCKKSTELAQSAAVEEKKAEQKKTTLLPPPCPYDCHDERCKVYSEGYCGVDTVAVQTNSNNPYDYVGGQHNSGLSYVLENNSGSASIRHVTNIYMNAHSYDTTSINNGLNYGIQHAYYNATFNSLTDNPRTGIDNALANGAISTNLYNYCDAIIAIFDNLSQTESTSVDATNYYNFANEIVAIETQIANDSNLTGVEKQELYCATSVARYSANYWTNYGIRQPEPSEQGSKVKTQAFKVLKARFSWGSFAKADVYGAISGALSGVTYGLISGPLVGTSVLAWAASAAVGNSALNALNQF